jgi:hypothetical protein
VGAAGGSQGRSPRTPTARTGPGSRGASG